MNDPFDRLQQAFDRVEPPDQWQTIEARAADDDAERVPTTDAGSGRRALLWWAAAAAVVALVVGGVVAIDRRSGPAPADVPTSTVPAPAPPRSLDCSSAEELSALVELLDAGQPPVTGEHPRGLGAMLDRAPHVVLVSTVTRISRRDGFTRLELATPEYLLGDGPVDAISFRSTWETDGPDPLDESVVVRGARLVAFARSLSSSPVWVPDPDGLYLGCAGTEIPARGVRGAVPDFLGGSIDEIAAQLTAGMARADTPSTTTVPSTTAPAGAPGRSTVPMECRGEADLTALIDALRTGLSRIGDEGSDGDVFTLMGRNAAVVRGTLLRVSRGPAGETVFTLGAVQSVYGDPATIGADFTGPFMAQVTADDPLVAGVTASGAELLAVVRPSATVPDGWVADSQGLFVACSDGSTRVRPVAMPAGFLDHSSLDAMAAQLAAHHPEVDPGPWGQPCTDLSSSPAPTTDPPEWEAFGPLGPVPGLDIALPVETPPTGNAAATAAAARIDGGLLVSVRSGGAVRHGGIVAAVGHDGSLRWRRCVAGYLDLAVPVGGGTRVLVRSGQIDGDIDDLDWVFLDAATGAELELPGDIAVRGGAMFGGRFAVFHVADHAMIDATSTVAVLDTETSTITEVPYPGGAFNHAGGTVRLSAYDVDGVAVLGLPGRDGRPVRVYVDGEWGPFDPSSSSPAMQALSAHIAADVDASFDATAATGLAAFDGWGNELWRRPDLGGHGGEGFGVAGPFGSGSRRVYLVNGCVDPPPGTFCEETVLMAVDAADGRTVWTSGERRGLGIAAGDLAIVTTDAGGDAYEMIDVHTGGRVEGTPIWEGNGSFRTDCCGGYEYQRAEVDGALAWTLMYDHIVVWYPAGTTASTVAVDLLGE